MAVYIAPQFFDYRRGQRGGRVGCRVQLNIRAEKNSSVIGRRGVVVDILDIQMSESHIGNGLKLAFGSSKASMRSLIFSFEFFPVGVAHK